MSAKGPARNVLIVTGQHFAEAPRKVDLHFMADSLRAQGDHVDFLVCRLSFVSRFLKDGRWNFARQRPLNRWVAIDRGLEEFIWYQAIHPMNLKIGILNMISGWLFRQYGRLLPKAVRNRLPFYTHILIESGPAPLLGPEIRKAAPDAQLIYHAADRLKTINVHPCVEAVLTETIGIYDLVHIMAEALRQDFPPDAPILYLPHGIAKAAFDDARHNPYTGGQNAVSVGDMLFDAGAIDVLAEANPGWTFHLFGKKAVPVVARPNIIAHGEVAFDTIISFIKFADIGIAPYRDSSSADYLSQSSLKMIQYSYCRLPIVAPAFASAGRDHVCAYQPGDAGSIRDAFTQAQIFDRSSIDTGSIMSWDEAVATLLD